MTYWRNGNCSAKLRDAAAFSESELQIVGVVRVNRK